MLIFVLLLLIIAAFSFNDLVPIYRNKQWKVFWTYIAIMAILVFAGALIRLNVDIPSPAVPLKKLVTIIFGQHGEV